MRKKIFAWIYLSVTGVIKVTRETLKIKDWEEEPKKIIVERSKGHRYTIEEVVTDFDLSVKVDADDSLMWKY